MRRSARSADPRGSTERALGLLEEDDGVAERVVDGHAALAPVVLDQPRARGPVVLGQQGCLERRKAAGPDLDLGARRAVTEVLRQFQDAVAFPDLQVGRATGLEAVLPVEGETEETEVELAGLRLVEDAHDRQRGAEALPRLSAAIVGRVAHAAQITAGS